jgi:di/tricarboxylate transporter
MGRPPQEQPGMIPESMHIAIVLLLIVVVFIAFVRETFAPDVVAMLAFGVLVVTGILTSKEALSVFSNAGPIAVGAMFVLSAAIERTGIIDRLGRVVIRSAGFSPVLVLIAFLAVVMFLSAFINNTPVVVILTPVAVLLARTMKISPSRLLIPLSYAAIFGGTTTLIGTSTNLLIAGLVNESGMPPITMFEITLPGVIMGLVGVAYLAIFGRWLLPDRMVTNVDTLERHFVTEFIVAKDSKLIGKSLQAAGLSDERGVKFLDLIRDGHSLRFGMEPITLQAGDRVVVRTNAADVMGLRESNEIAIAMDDDQVSKVESHATRLMEGVVAPQSRLRGYLVSDLNFRRLFGVYIVAIYRQGALLSGGFDKIVLTPGDTLLLEGPADGLRRLFERRALVNLTEPTDAPFRREKAPIAATAVILVMALAALNLMPIEVLALVAAAVVVATRCLTAEEAYEAIQWPVLMLIFGMLAVGMAMEKTGAAALIVEHLATVVGALGPILVVAMIYLVTSFLTEIVSNNASAVLLTPIAIRLAEQMSVSPRPFIMAVLFAASASFATPIGYQTNTFVYGVGGYKFSDFLRVGLPLNVINWLLGTMLILWFWPL